MKRLRWIRSALGRGARALGAVACVAGRGARALGAVACLVLTVALSSHAQDLDSEFSLKPELRFRHVSGLGPSLLECKLSDRNSLRCVANQALVQVECRSENLLLEAKGSTRHKVKDTAFLCDRVGNPNSLSSIWNVFLMGPDGGMSHWVVQAVSVKQEELSYRSEMKAEGQKKSSLSRLEVSTLALVRAGTPSDTYYGLQAQALFRERLAMNVIYTRPLTRATSTSSSNFELGIEVRPFVNEVSYLATDLGYGWDGHTTQSLDEISAGINYVHNIFSDRLRGSLYARSQWPMVDQLRASYQGGAEIFFGPFFTHWQLGARAGYLSELWTHQGVNWSFKGIEAQINLSWVGVSF